MTPVLRKDETEDKVPMFEEVDVDIDGRAHIGQQTGHVTRAFCNIAFEFLAFHFYTSIQNQNDIFWLTYPDWPVEVLLVQTGLVELVDVGDPLEAVAGDEDSDDDEADLRQLDLLGPLVDRAPGDALR